MAEWLIAPVLKTGIVLGTIEGSNPSLSFCLLNTFVSLYVFLCSALLYHSFIKKNEWLG
jgi:hypothetical protein